MSLEELRKGKVLLIDKPLEWTSFDVVNKIRYSILKKYNIKRFKVGHAGTLDPLATGLLIICIGKATKTINEYQNQTKEYIGTFILGGTTPSYDMETQVDKIYPISHITEEMITRTAKNFVGQQAQIPPIFSAIKRKGKKLYELARMGEKIEIAPRQIEIFEFEILSVDLPKVIFRVNVSKGTYIRSLAYDFGKALQSGAYLSELKRTKIGNFLLENAVSHQNWIDELNKQD